MATPAENVATIQAFWAAVAQLPKTLATTQGAESGLYGYNEVPNKFYYAANAMQELVEQAATNDYTRTSVFGAASMFETCLVADSENDWWRSWILNAPDSPLSFAAKSMLQTQGARPLRQIMLDGVYRAASGGWFSPRTADGITTWLHSASVSGSGVSATISADTCPGAVQSLLHIIAELAIPQFWATFLMNQPAFAALNSRLATTHWSSNSVQDFAYRGTIQALAARAQARVQTMAALSAGSLPTFPTADGNKAPTAPPIPKKWYQRGELWAGGIVGIVGGAAASMKH